MKYLITLGALFLCLFSFNTVDAATAKVPKRLFDAVKEFESLGGTGKWFSSKLEDRLGDSDGVFYLVKSLPQESSPDAKIFLLRTDHTLKALTIIANKQGAPIIFGLIPESSAVYAAAITRGYQLADDAIKTANLPEKKAVILLTPETTIFTLAHENRHWLDFSDSDFTPTLHSRFVEFVESNGLDEQVASLLTLITIEIRGHIVQAKQAWADWKNGRPYMDRAGNLVEGPPDAQQDQYLFEQQMARQMFVDAYRPTLSEIFSNLDANQKNDLLAILSQYDSSDDPANEITFKKVMGLH